MSDTPRTDRVIRECLDLVPADALDEYVKLTKQLERELIAATAECDHATKHADALSEATGSIAATLCREAAWDNGLSLQEIVESVIAERDALKAELEIATADADWWHCETGLLQNDMARLARRLMDVSSKLAIENAERDAALAVSIWAQSKRRVYISGPMTGIPEYNYPAFRAAAERLRAEGCEVVSPAELHGGDFTKTWEQYLDIDIAAMQGCNEIVLLPGWSESRGAKRELAEGLRLNMRVTEYAHFTAMAAKENPRLTSAAQTTMKDGDAG